MEIKDVEISEGLRILGSMITVDPEIDKYYIVEVVSLDTIRIMSFDPFTGERGGIEESEALRVLELIEGWVKAK